MTPHSSINDPAYPVLAIDLITNILTRAGNPAEVGLYLTEEIRELTGASCVVFIQLSTENPAAPYRLFSIHPQRRQTWAESTAGRRLISLISTSNEAKTLTADSDTEIGQSLTQEGFSESLVIPLLIGPLKVGSLLLLGLPDPGQSKQVKELLSTLAILVALVLRNAFLYENQEATIAARTRELESANAALRLTQFSIDTSNAAIFWLNDKGRYIYFNKAACALLSCPPEIMADKYASDFTPIHPSSAWSAHWDELKKNKSLTFETNLVSYDGRTVPVEINANFVAFGDHEINCAFVRDLSERKALEDRLLQAQKMEAVGQLAGGVAHDFNNILAAIMLQAGMVTGRPELDTETRIALQDISESAKRAADLTRQLLIFSRRTAMNPQLIDLNELVDNVSRLLRRLIGENIALKIKTLPNLPSVQADQHMLEVVLMNLAINARDAMPEGGTIEIATRFALFTRKDVSANADRRTGGFVCLSLRDNGLGMDARTQQKIFEPFFTTKEVGKGTGLGLATAHGIIAQHKGWVEVESALGKGTCFQVYLPASEGRDTVTSGPAEREVKGGNECILLVEDEPALRTAARICLRRFGYAVLEASSGVEALALWQCNSEIVKLVVTDMVMPEGINGMDLVLQMRETKPDLKVIISSGYSSTMPDPVELEKRNIQYLPKPYDMQTLGETVRGILDK